MHGRIQSLVVSEEDDLTPISIGFLLKKGAGAFQVPEEKGVFDFVRAMFRGSHICRERQ